MENSHFLLRGIIGTNPDQKLSKLLHALFL